MSSGLKSDRLVLESDSNFGQNPCLSIKLGLRWCADCSARCYVLEIELVVTSQPKSRMEGLAWCFDKLGSYWCTESQLGRSNLLKYLTQPQIALEWVVGNATALHQEIIQGDKYHKLLLINWWQQL